MLTGNDFVILTTKELETLYNTILDSRTREDYIRLQKLGSLSLIEEIRLFLNRQYTKEE